MKENKKKICPICGKSKLIKSVITETFTYEGKEVIIPNYVIWTCYFCKESIVDQKCLRETSEKLKEAFGIN